jgi:C1A family cysteine protease
MQLDVELWCDPYTRTQGTCGSFCASGNTYAAVAGSVKRVGGTRPAGVLQMQYELVRGGPGVVSFMVVNDFFGYSKGIYVPSATATVVGGHAVSLVGWGVEAGVPYWICQNSWGAGWGENGFFRIQRGADTAQIESFIGIVTIKPLPPSACPNTNCCGYCSTRIGN